MLGARVFLTSGAAKRSYRLCEYWSRSVGREVLRAEAGGKYPMLFGIQEGEPLSYRESPQIHKSE